MKHKKMMTSDFLNLITAYCKKKGYVCESRKVTPVKYVYYINYCEPNSTTDRMEVTVIDDGVYTIETSMFVDVINVDYKRRIEFIIDYLM